MEDKITISLEEYKELLIIKGKYEELKSQQIIKPNYREIKDLSERYKESEYPYKITCEKEIENHIPGL